MTFKWANFFLDRNEAFFVLHEIFAFFSRLDTVLLVRVYAFCVVKMKGKKNNNSQLLTSTSFQSHHRPHLCLSRQSSWPYLYFTCTIHILFLFLFSSVAVVFGSYNYVIELCSVQCIIISMRTQYTWQNGFENANISIRLVKCHCCTIPNLVLPHNYLQCTSATTNWTWIVCVCFFHFLFLFFSAQILLCNGNFVNDCETLKIYRFAS